MTQIKNIKCTEEGVTVRVSSKEKTDTFWKKKNKYKVDTVGTVHEVETQLPQTK